MLVFLSYNLWVKHGQNIEMLMNIHAASFNVALFNIKLNIHAAEHNILCFVYTHQCEILQKTLSSGYLEIGAFPEIHFAFRAFIG